jgi:hypothetical protein
MAKKVPVTSVTPAIKVKATSKAKQANTRKMVGAIAAATPAGRVAKAVGTAAKAATKVNSAAKANARGLKAANKPTRASKSNEVKMVNKLAETNKKMGQKNPDAVRNAARVYDQIRSVQTRAAARNAAAKKGKK